MPLTVLRMGNDTSGPGDGTFSGLPFRISTDAVDSKGGETAMILAPAA